MNFIPERTARRQGENKARVFLENAFRGKPINTLTYKQLLKKYPIISLKTKDDDKSGASGATTIIDKGRIIKLYEPRGFEDIWNSDKSDLEKRNEYIRQVRKKYIKYLEKKKRDYDVKDGDQIGDDKLHYIRSIRDIYIGLRLQNVYVDEEPIVSQLIDYGFAKKDNSYMLYKVEKNLGLDGFKELKNYKPKTVSIKPVKMLYQLLKVLYAKYHAFNKDGMAVGCHRDLHPGNIFYKINKDDTVSIRFIDFDLSITDQPILNRSTYCDRKTMQDDDSHKRMINNINKTTVLYTFPWDRRPRFLFYNQDADLMQYMTYWRYLKTKTPPNIRDKLRELKTLFETFVFKEVPKQEYENSKEKLYRLRKEAIVNKEAFFVTIKKGLKSIIDFEKGIMYSQPEKLPIGVDFEALFKQAIQEIQYYYKFQKKQMTNFTIVNRPSSAIGSKGAKSWILKKKINETWYVFKLSDKEERYKKDKMKVHLSKLFTTLEKFEHQDIMLLPMFAQLYDSHLLLLYPLCKEVKAPDRAERMKLNNEGKRTDTQRLKVLCTDTNIQRKFFKFLQYLHNNDFVGVDWKAENLLFCKPNEKMYNITDYENCISTYYHDTLPDIGQGYNFTFQNVQKENIIVNFAKYRWYYMVIDYIGLFCMITRHTLNTGLIVTDNNIKKLEEYIEKRRKLYLKNKFKGVDSCGYALLKQIVLLLKDPMLVKKYLTINFYQILPKQKRPPKFNFNNYAKALHQTRFEEAGVQLEKTDIWFEEWFEEYNIPVIYRKETIDKDDYKQLFKRCWDKLVEFIENDVDYNTNDFSQEIIKDCEMQFGKKFRFYENKNRTKCMKILTSAIRFMESFLECKQQGGSCDANVISIEFLKLKF